MWRIKNFFTNIKNLITWFPIIWKDRQWDFYYIEKLLLKKVQLIIKYHKNRNFFVGVENEIKWMEKCEMLLFKLQNNTYWKDEWDNKYPSNNGLSAMHIKHLNLKKKNIEKFYGDYWEIKTKRLFWKIFTWRYEYWWD